MQTLNLTVTTISLYHVCRSLLLQPTSKMGFVQQPSQASSSLVLARGTEAHGRVACRSWRVHGDLCRRHCVSVCGRHCVSVCGPICVILRDLPPPVARFGLPPLPFPLLLLLLLLRPHPFVLSPIFSLFLVYLGLRASRRRRPASEYDCGAGASHHGACNISDTVIRSI
jgi:hypothetical protein